MANKANKKLSSLENVVPSDYAAQASYGISFKDIKKSKLYKELRNRNWRLLITAIMIFVIGVRSMSLYEEYIGLIIIVISLYLFYLCWQRYNNPFYYPDIKHLLKFGNHAKHYLDLIDKSLKSDEKIKDGRFIFSEEFVFVPSFYRYRWYHKSELCWAYITQVKHTLYHVIVTSITYKLNLFFDDGNSFTYDIKKPKEDLLFLHSIAPFAIFGYSKELKRIWVRNRESFIQQVKKRYKEFKKSPKSFLKKHLE